MPAQRRAQGHGPWTSGFGFDGRFGGFGGGSGNLLRGRHSRNGGMRRRSFDRRSRDRGGFHVLIERERDRGFVIPLVIECVRTSAIHPEVFPDEIGDVIVQRAGMGFFLGHSQFGEQVENPLRLYLELPRQLIDAGFSHIQN